MPRPLKIFMRGKKVTMLQETLHRMGYPMHDQAGQFGASTRDAVKDIQKRQGLKPTGSVDQDLLHMLQQGSPSGNSKPETAPSQQAETQSLQENPANQQQLDTLVRLLIGKGIITQEELSAQATRPQAKRVTQAPLV